MQIAFILTALHVQCVTLDDLPLPHFVCPSLTDPCIFSWFHTTILWYIFSYHFSMSLPILLFIRLSQSQEHGITYCIGENPIGDIAESFRSLPLNSILFYAQLVHPTPGVWRAILRTFSNVAPISNVIQRSVCPCMILICPHQHLTKGWSLSPWYSFHLKMGKVQKSKQVQVWKLLKMMGLTLHLNPSSLDVNTFDKLMSLYSHMHPPESTLYGTVQFHTQNYSGFWFKQCLSNY